MRTPTTLLGLAALCAGTKALTITSPSPESYWVQFSTNTIAWASSSGDPDAVTLQIINPTSKSFAGPFSIAEYVKTSLKSYDVTNVTLASLDGYQVQMVNSLNNSQVLATSGLFSVKVGGTTPAAVTYAPGTQDAKNSSSSSTNGSMTNSASSNRSNSNSFQNNGNANGNAKSFATHLGAPALSGLFLGSSCLLALVL